MTKLGLVATREAIKSANLNVKDKKIGLFFGTSIGGIGDPIFQDGVINGEKDILEKYLLPLVMQEIFIVLQLL